MPNKKTSTNGSSGNINPVIVDQILTSKSGNEFRIVVDISIILDDMTKYHDALLLSRSIPWDVEDIHQIDPLAIWISENMPWEPVDKIIGIARSHYRKLQGESQREAMILAVTKHNKFDKEPKGYEEEKDEALPGIIDLPTVKKNISNPVERRLKQVLDFLMENTDIMPALHQHISTAFLEVARLSEDIDENGFRVKRTS